MKDPLEFKVIQPGTQTMARMLLPTCMVNFGTGVVDQMDALRRNSTSLSLAVGYVWLFHFQKSQYGLPCTKEEITNHKNVGELLTFDVQNLKVTCYFTYLNLTL